MKPGDRPKPCHAESATAQKPAEPGGRHLVPGICVLLALAVLLVFGQTSRHEFINCDDGPYVYENTQVVQGLTLTGIVWAFTHSQAGFWHPLTWISHMLDCQLYGLNAGGHHLTNVLLHAASAILLFLVLRRMMGLRSNKSIGVTTPQGGTLWPSAFVAAVFAIHPLRVESVAWVSERKDVLSGLFFMLTLWAWACYAESQSRAEGRESRAKAASALDPRLWTLDYWLVLLFFALGLMSKQMLVTVPFVLLLLDYWPLERFTIYDLRFTIPRLLLEKLPLFLLAIAAGFIAFLTQKSDGAVATIESLSLGLRLANGLVSYVTYILKMLWPDNLAIFYPYPAEVPMWRIVVAGALLLFITMQAVIFARQRPYLLVGWLWYLGMLVPVIGLVQVGLQSHADRFTYLPQIGLYLVVAWAAKDLTGSWRWHRQVLRTGAVFVVAVLMLCAWKQTSSWRNSELVWTQTLACTSGNYFAHNNFGDAVMGQGRLVEATRHFQMAIEIKPNYAEAYYNLGVVLDRQGKPGEAIDHYQKALEINPNHAEAHNNLGMVLAQQGRTAEAIGHFQKAIEVKPGFEEAHNNLGNALALHGKYVEAIEQYRQALVARPDYAEAHNNLGNALLLQGRYAEAVGHFQKALQLRPDDTKARQSLDTALGLLNQSVKGTKK
jgi:protein O-mannosyl-transferase